MTGSSGDETTWAGAGAGMPAPPGWSASEPHRPPPKRRLGAPVIAGALTLIVALTLTATLWTISRDAGSLASGPSSSGSPSSGSLTTTLPAAGVIDINTYTKVLGRADLVPEGAGSGMVLTADGEVLTNNHVVKGAWKIEATVPGGRTYTASVVGVDPSRDVALLQLSGASGLATISPGDASALSVGDRVSGIGNALGSGGPPEVATGVVTAIDQSITARDPGGSSEKLYGLIQTDAHIQPGESGGALVNDQGQVVGMVTAGSVTDAYRPATSSTRGFAIPIDEAMTVVAQIRSGSGDPSVVLGDRGYLGVEVRNLDRASAAQLGSSRGALVVGLDPAGRADEAGITVPAIITAVDGQPVTTADSLGPLLHAHVPGETVSVRWVDDSGSRSASIRLVPGPAV